MLCFPCCRLAATAVRRGIAVPRVGRASQLLVSPSVSRAGALPGPSTASVARGIAARTYSTSSDAPPASAAASQPAAPTPEKPDYLDDAESAIWDTLVAQFSPTELTVQDISGGCGSMYGIEIASDKFCGVNMLKQQRMVNAALGDRIKSWHGIQLRTRTP